MIGLLTNLGLSSRVAKHASYVVCILAICGALYGAYCWAWDQGRDHERQAWNDKVSEIRAKRQSQADRAATGDVVIADQATTAIEDRRKELDNATAKLPDQELTPRQRARADAELRRQGR